LLAIEIELRDGRLRGKLAAIVATSINASPLSHLASSDRPGPKVADVLTMDFNEPLRHENVERLADDLVMFPPEDGFCASVEHDDPLVIIDRDDGVCRNRDQPRKLCLRFLYRAVQPSVVQRGRGTPREVLSHGHVLRREMSSGLGAR